MATKEKFLILDFRDDGLELYLLRFDSLTKRVDAKKLKAVGQSPLEAIPKIKKFLLNIFSFQFPPPKVIISFSPDFALTYYEHVVLNRDRPNELMTEADLDNLISQALWKIFDEKRRQSAKQLVLSDLDILLADTKITDFRIDGRRVLDPLRHSGREASIGISQTFVNRTIFKKIVSVLPRRVKLLLVVDGGAATSRLLSSRFSQSRDFIFADVLDARTNLYSVSQSSGLKIGFHDYFPWGEKNFFEGVARDLKIPVDLIQSLVKKISEGKVSLTLGRQLKKIISEELAMLIHGLERAKETLKVNSLYLVFRPLRGIDFFPKMVRLVEADRLMEDLGFVFSSDLKNSSISSIASFLEFYFLREGDILNHIAKRRMRWLMP
ncbi:hypothetical protein HYV91_00805 [Candidatus Wolfebacteria bacterium]|nr:hypothetical protein [Candidatus Wolfebacteria bacterium]